MNHNCLIYQTTDGLWHIEDRNRHRVAGSPTTSEQDAERVAENYAAGCLAIERASREETRRRLACGYDPTA